MKLWPVMIVLAAGSACSSVPPSPSPPRGGAETSSACATFEAVRRDEHPPEVLSDPSRYWRDLEDCFAPGGDHCERAWVMGSAMPSMAGPTDEELERQRPAFLRACRALPPATQRCLTSDALSLPDECPPGWALGQLDAVTASE